MTQYYLKAAAPDRNVVGYMKLDDITAISFAPDLLMAKVRLAGVDGEPRELTFKSQEDYDAVKEQFELRTQIRAEVE